MRLLVLFVASTLALACTPGGGGGSGSGSGTGGDGGLPPPGGGGDLRAAAGDLAGFFCDYIEQCTVADDDFLLLELLLESGGDCPAFFQRLFEDSYTDEFVAGVSFDEAAFRRCRTAALDACVIFDEVPECDDVFTGLTPEGGGCYDSDLCAPGLYCDYDPQAEGECNETCQARRPAGEPCEYDAQCADTADATGFCRGPEDGEGTCDVFTIGARVAAGEQCGLLPQGEGWRRVDCEAGSYCTGDDDEAGACRLIPALGEACEDDGVPCAGGVCIAGTCTALDVIDQPGAACDQRMLQFCNPFAGVFCLDGTCVRSDGREDEPCSDSGLGIPCAAGLHCEDASNTCRPKLADGSPCDPDGDYDACTSGYCGAPDGGGDPVCMVDPFRSACQ